MSVESFEDVLNTLLDLRPFRLFTIELNNGKRFEVDHPHAISMRGGTATYTTSGGMFIFFSADTVSHIFPDTANTPTGAQSQ